MERRRDERVQTCVNAACRIPARPMGAKVHDASRGGLRIEVNGTRIEVGSTAIVELPALAPVSGQVVWSHGTQAGIRLSRPLVGAAAVALGVDMPAPVEPEPIAANEDRNAGTRLQHWFSRLLKRPFRA
jgi:hypothetical protein